MSNAEPIPTPARAPARNVLWLVLPPACDGIALLIFGAGEALKTRREFPGSFEFIVPAVVLSFLGITFLLAAWNLYRPDRGLITICSVLAACCTMFTAVPLCIIWIAYFQEGQLEGTLGVTAVFGAATVLNGTWFVHLLLARRRVFYQLSDTRGFEVVPTPPQPIDIQRIDSSREK